MCNYCTGKEIKIDEDYCSDTMQIEDRIMTISGVTPYGYENVDFEVSVKINFCPMCGRKLN